MRGTQRVAELALDKLRHLAEKDAEELRVALRDRREERRVAPARLDVDVRLLLDEEAQDVRRLLAGHGGVAQADERRHAALDGRVVDVRAALEDALDELVRAVGGLGEVVERREAGVVPEVDRAFRR